MVVATGALAFAARNADGRRTQRAIRTWRINLGCRDIGLSVTFRSGLMKVAGDPSTCGGAIFERWSAKIASQKIQFVGPVRVDTPGGASFVRRNQKGCMRKADLDCANRIAGRAGSRPSLKFGLAMEEKRIPCLRSGV